MKNITHQKYLKRHSDEIITHLGYDPVGCWKIFSKIGIPFPNRRVCLYLDEIWIKSQTVDFVIHQEFFFEAHGGQTQWELLVLSQGWRNNIKVAGNNWHEMIKDLLMERIPINLENTPEENVILADMGEL